MKNIALAGLVFDSPNKGCMALAYSFMEMLTDIYDKDEVEIYILSNTEYNIDNLNKYFSKISLIQYSLKKIKSIANIKNTLKKCDIVYDFTEGDSFSDIYGIKRMIKVSLIKKWSIRYGCKLVLGPQTYGPYFKKISQKMAKDIFKGSYLVTSRDNMSAQLVKKYTGNEIPVYTDVAFALSCDRDIVVPKTDKKKIGINISALLWNGGYTQNNQFGLSVDYRQYCRSLIERLNDEGYEIHLISHVHGKDMSEIENDYMVNLKLKNEYEFVKVADMYKYPMETKGYILQMDFFIGARMHATIAAFSSGVITIPFSYSRKFEGLYNALGYNYVVSGKELTTQEAIDKTLDYIKNYSSLQLKQEEALCIAKKEIEDFRCLLKKIDK